VHDLARDLDRVPVQTLHDTPRHKAFDLSRRALRDALSPRGPVMNHALRVSITSAIAVVIGRTWTADHPTWVTITVLAVLQPYLGPTLVRAIERVIGTLIGALIVFAATAAVHDPLALSVILFPLSVAAVYTRPRSYRLFVLFLTPVFVLVTELGHASWPAAWARLVDVAIGGALAIVAALIVPSRERPRLSDALAAMLDSITSYVRLADGSTSDREVITAARRAVGVALETAEASLERMLAEPRLLHHRAEDAMYLVTYGRRIAAGLTSLLEGGGRLPAQIRDYLVGVLDDARAHVTSGAVVTRREPPAAATPDLARIVRRGELVAQVVRDMQPGG
jgi:uncharacterized membrane protein YccC